MSSSSKENVVSDASKHWSQFYGSNKASIEPSSFARFIDRRYPDHRSVVEFGCGNGRDAIYYCQSGRQVLGFDLCREAIDKCNELARLRSVSQMGQFEVADIINEEELLPLVRRHSSGHSPTIFYARFFLHSIDEAREDSLFRVVSSSLAPRDVFCVEFRTTSDAQNLKLYGEHYRRFLEVDGTVQKCKAHGMAVGYAIEGTDLAVHGNENPHVARIIGERQTNA